jgi:hypothetical protein
VWIIDWPQQFSITSLKSVALASSDSMQTIAMALSRSCVIVFLKSFLILAKLLKDRSASATDTVKQQKIHNAVVKFGYKLLSFCSLI